MSEVDETFNRIKNHKSVRGIVICNDDGKIIRTTYTEKKEEGEALAKLIPPLCQKAKMTMQGLSKEEKLTFLRVKSKTQEIMIAPDDEYMLIVVQNSATNTKEENQ